MQFLGLSLALTSLVAAFPDGAPGCKISRQFIAQGMEEETKDLGYSISVARSGEGFEFKLNNANRKDLQGLLLYVTTGSVDADNHVGKFVSMNTQKFKYQKASKCSARGISGLVEATVTHANANREPLSSTFKWTASAKELSADLYVHAVVASSDKDDDYLPKWQVLEPVLIAKSKEENGSAGSAGSVTVSPASKTVSKAVSTAIGSYDVYSAESKIVLSNTILGMALGMLL